MCSRRIPERPDKSNQVWAGGEATPAHLPFCHTRGGSLRLLYGNRYDFAFDNWIVGHVVVIAEDKLEGVLAGAELDRRFSLPSTEVLMVVVGREGVLVIFELGIDDQMVMAGFFLFHTSRGDTHP